LERAFGVERIVVTTFQAISGAGRPGPSASEMTDNVIPFIAGEEEKLAREPGKILGQVDSREIRHASFRVSALVHRVPVSHGHLLAVSASLAGEPSPEEVTAALGEFRGSEECRSLPTAPDRLLEVLPGEDRPQPRLDRGRGGGMTVTVGRIRSCPVLGVKLSVLSHNLLRGAAGAAVLNAELCRARGLVGAGAAA
ncbi:MAG TPA: Asd/ArgC dimerization domain-containing protein, partial [Longimicrobiales bacterium]|nr:Asd/ArgC dimerization domain-containing protein [Longimicrobiales bacterium]